MRRHLVLPVLLASTLGLAGCGQGDDPAAGAGDVAALTADSTGSAVATPTPTDPTTAPASLAAPATTAPDADCTAASLPDAQLDLGELDADAVATAEFLLDAARRCDEPLLVTTATESGTSLSFGHVDASTALGLPEADDAYAAIVTLLTRTSWAAQADDADPATFVWPRVASGDWADDDTAWQEVVDAGLLTAEEAAEQRGAGAGYLGWRLGITAAGDWQFLVAGD